MLTCTNFEVICENNMDLVCSGPELLIAEVFIIILGDQICNARTKLCYILYIEFDDSWC